MIISINQNTKPIQLLLSHYNNERITEMINSLHHSGSLELIYNDYSTPIYHYYSDAADSLSNYEIELFHLLKIILLFFISELCIYPNNSKSKKYNP